MDSGYIKEKLSDTHLFSPEAVERLVEAYGSLEADVARDAFVRSIQSLGVNVDGALTQSISNNPLFAQELFVGIRKAFLETEHTEVELPSLSHL